MIPGATHAVCSTRERGIRAQAGILGISEPTLHVGASGVVGGARFCGVAETNGTSLTFRVVGGRGALE